jgi:hypothetical protein
MTTIDTPLSTLVKNIHICIQEPIIKTHKQTDEVSTFEEDHKPFQKARQICAMQKKLVSPEKPTLKLKDQTVPKDGLVDILTKHNDARRVLWCEYCGVSFTCSSSLSRHRLHRCKNNPNNTKRINETNQHSGKITQLCEKIVQLEEKIEKLTIAKNPIGQQPNINAPNQSINVYFGQRMVDIF